MPAQTFVLIKSSDYANAIEAIRLARARSRVEIKGPRRTADQNARFWAMMGELSEKITYQGRLLTPRKWAYLFLDSLNDEADIVPSLNGYGFVDIGRRSTSDLEVADFSSLIEIIYAWASPQGITFKEPAIEAQRTR